MSCSMELLAFLEECERELSCSQKEDKVLDRAPKVSRRPKKGQKGEKETNRKTCDISCLSIDAGGVFETTVSKGVGETNWVKEVTIAGKDIVKRNGYSAPRKMIWDGVKSRPNDISKHDLLCFVLSCYRISGEMILNTDMAVYRVTNLRGRNGGREWWGDRKTQAIDLRLVGFVSRHRFAKVLSRRNDIVPRGTTRCVGASAEVLMENLDVNGFDQGDEE